MIQRNKAANNSLHRPFISTRHLCRWLFKEMKCNLARCPNPNFVHLPSWCTFFFLHVQCEPGHGVNTWSKSGGTWLMCCALELLRLPGLPKIFLYSFFRSPQEWIPSGQNTLVYRGLLDASGGPIVLGKVGWELVAERLHHSWYQ